METLQRGTQRYGDAQAMKKSWKRKSSLIGIGEEELQTLSVRRCRHNCSSGCGFAFPAAQIQYAECLCRVA